MRELVLGTELPEGYGGQVTLPSRTNLQKRLSNTVYVAAVCPTGSCSQDI